MLKIYSKYLFIARLENNMTDRGTETIDIAVYLDGMNIGEHEHEIEQLVDDYCESGGWQFVEAQCLFKQPFLMKPPDDPQEELSTLAVTLAEQVGELAGYIRELGRLR